MKKLTKEQSDYLIEKVDSLWNLFIKPDDGRRFVATEILGQVVEIIKECSEQE